jgi:hypothetical protein
MSNFLTSDFHLKNTRQFHFSASFAYAELSTLIRRQGGDFAFILECFKGFHTFFGPLPAFLYLWMKLVTSPASVAIGALSFAHYVTVPIFPNCETPINVLRTVAALCIRKYQIDRNHGRVDSNWEKCHLPFARAIHVDYHQKYGVCSKISL